MFIFGQILNQ